MIDFLKDVRQQGMRCGVCGNMNSIEVIDNKTYCGKCKNEMLISAANWAFGGEK